MSLKFLLGILSTRSLLVDPAEPPAAADKHSDMCRQLSRQIASRTSRRVGRLEVYVSADRVVVRGLAPSYYVKQLALSAVLATIDPAKTQVQMEIEVGAPALPSERLQS